MMRLALSEFYARSPRSPRDPHVKLAGLFRASRGTSSQTVYAKSLGVTQPHLSRIERAKSPPGLRMVARLGRPKAFELFEELRIAAIRAHLRAEARAT